MGIRLFVIFFSAIVAFTMALIGNALAQAFLKLVATYNLSPLYKTLTPIGVIFVFAIVGFFLGTRLFRNMAEIGKGLKRIPAEDKIASIFGTLMFAAISGGAVGPFVAGAVHDATGSYAIAWWICVGMTLLSIVAIWQASPGKVRAVAGRI